VAAAAVLAKCHVPQGDVTEADYTTAFIVIQEEAHRLMGDATYIEFAQALSWNPVLSALAQRWEDSHRCP